MSIFQNFPFQRKFLMLLENDFQLHIKVTEWGKGVSRLGIGRRA